jgi:hypothetical protein
MTPKIHEQTEPIVESIGSAFLVRWVSLQFRFSLQARFRLSSARFGFLHALQARFRLASGSLPPGFGKLGVVAFGSLRLASGDMIS